MRLLVATFLSLVLLPAGASAAELEFDVDPSGVRFGTPHEGAGRLTEAGAALAAQPIVVEGRRYPFTGAFRKVGEATTDADGRFGFRGRFDRNVELRAVAPAQRARSALVRAYVFPRPVLSFRALDGGSVRITQTYRLPAGSRLTAPTLFYAGPRGSQALPRIGRAAPRKVGRGRWRASLDFRLPRDWNGRFRYAACFRYSEGSGLGDPRASCPRKFRY
jgi:hypothetical protein